MGWWISPATQTLFGLSNNQHLTFRGCPHLQKWLELGGFLATVGMIMPNYVCVHGKWVLKDLVEGFVSP